MRALVIAGILCVSLAASAQPDAKPEAPKGETSKPHISAEELMRSMPAPQVSIVVREHHLGPDMFTVTAVSPTYPQDLLSRQCQLIAKYGNSDIRGLQLTRLTLGPSTDQAFLRATFSADGFIDRPNQKIRIEPIVRAFAGAREMEINSLMITFDGEKPTQSTLKSYADKNVLVTATAGEMPPGIDYRVLLKTQDPLQIQIPESAKAAQAVPAPQTPSSVGPALPLQALLLIVAGGVILAAFVYFLALKLPRK